MELSSSMAASEEEELLMAGDQTVWADATNFMSDLCQEMDPGELIHGENFSLFESMAALEIMDPKMDGGMDIGGPKSVEDAIALGMAPTDLNIKQIVDIMDHILSCEATWHKGHSLAQTVFSSIYMMKLERTILLPVLYAFCKITRATCSIVRADVALTRTHEEEDIFSTAFGLPVDENDSDCLAVLNTAEEVCTRQLRNAEKKNKKDIQPLQDDETLEYGFCQSVLSRLRFRKAYYQALVHMEKPQGRGLETARKHISTALSELKLIRSSSEFLSSRHTSSEDCLTTASRRNVIGFNENINRNLLPPTPPRSMKILPWSEALDYFERLLRDLDRVCTVPLHIELEPLIQLIVDFQKSHPDLVARSRLQLLALQNNKLFGMRTIPDVIYKSIYRQHEPVRDTGLNNFLQQTSFLIISLLKILCSHPAWQCRKLGKALEDWSNLFQQVDVIGDPSETGETKNIAPIVTWIACQASWIAKQYLMLGFDLELYSLDEHCMIYWYLDHILLTYRHYKMERDQMFDAKKTETAEAAKKKGKKIKKKVPVKKQERDLLLLQCLSDLCKAYLWILIALRKDGKLLQRKTEFTSEQEIYLQRFELLHILLVPAPLSFYHFKEATKFEHYSARELYHLSYEHLMGIEKALQDMHHEQGDDVAEMTSSQTTSEIRQLEQVINRNRIALQIIDRSAPGKLHVSFQFLQHPCFGVLVVKNK